MSRRRRWGWFESAPKKPPPEHGIKVRTSGTTWWGQRWIDALERISAGYASRLARGRTYARAGRTHDLVVQGGTVTAKVTGTRARPYDVTLTLRALPGAVWDRAIGEMARKARFTADLLGGEMPREIDTVFAAAGTSLFPVKEDDLTTECSCPDWANPCKHVAATHYVLGEALDRDPFLLFELRGRTKAQVLDALRVVRLNHGADAEPRRRKASKPAPTSAVPAVTLGRMKADNYDAPRAPLPALRLRFQPPTTPGSLLDQLGTPAGWGHDASPQDLLGPRVRTAAANARALAMAEATEPDGAAPTDGVAAAKAKRTATRQRGGGARHRRK